MDQSGDVWRRLKELQKIVGPEPKIEVAGFSNWASTQVRDEILAVSPTTVEQVQAVLRGALQLGIRVRAAGRKHSWTPLFSDEEDIVMYVEDIKRPDGPQIELQDDPDDPKSKLVTMATGVTVRELMEFELNNNISVLSNVVLRVVQMGGVVAPACHGVGWDVKSVSDAVVSMRIINSHGDMKTYSLKEDEDMMRAVQANLGLWGIIVDLTLKVRSPEVIVETQNIWMKVKDIFYDKKKLHEIVTGNESVEIFWFPFNSIPGTDVSDWNPMEDKVWLRLVNEARHPGPLEPPEDYEFSGISNFLQAEGFEYVKSFIIENPHITPEFLKTQVQSLKKQFRPKVYQQLVHAIHFRGSVQVVPVYDMEWAFSVDDDFTNVCTAIQHVVTLVKDEADAGRFPLNLPLEMRFTADSDVYMAPLGGSGRGHKVAMEVLSIAHTPGWEEFCQKVADVWQTMREARPHWCKEWQHLRGIDQFIQKSYAPVLPKYLAALERSGADPHGIFLNKRLEKIFYPQGHSGWAKVKAEIDAKSSSERGAGKEPLTGQSKQEGKSPAHVILCDAETPGMSAVIKSETCLD